MKKLLLIFGSILLLLIFIVISYALITNGEGFFRTIGIDEVHLYEYVIEAKGEPLREEEADGQLYVYYDGLRIVFPENKTALIRAEVTGKNYGFSLGLVKVGSSKAFVEGLYRFKQKIKDLPQGEFGFIDDDVWVRFKYDDNDKVKEIYIYFGP